jgi:two-component system response regulator DesR
MLRVLLAEDMHMVRGALVSLLSREPDIDVVAEVESGDHVLAAALTHQPHVAVLDFELPGRDGIVAAVELKARLPHCRTMILTGVGRPAVLRRALSEGVAGVLLKDSPPDRLAESIRRIGQGEQVIDPKLAAATLSLPPSTLSARETDVLRLVADGADAHEIGRRLQLSAGTVRNYIANASMKLDARNKVDAVRIARAADWI